MSALLPLIGALFAVSACYALGSLLLAQLDIVLPGREKLPLGFTLGAAALHLTVFVVLALHVAYASVLIAILGVVIATAWATGAWRVPAKAEPASPQYARQSWLTRIVRVLLLAAVALYTILYFFNAWAPEISPDGSSYHLPMIARYLRAHSFVAVPTDVYSTLSEGVELIFLPAFAIGGGSAAALVHFTFLVALALMIRAYGRRMGHALAGEAAAALVYLSPIAGIDGTSAYVDAGVAAIVFSLFYWTELWDTDQRNALLVCIGLLGGYCYAAKYTAAVMAVYALAFVIWRTALRRTPAWKAAALVIACAAVMAVPWMLKDWTYVHNPVAPFGNHLFRNPYIHVEFERGWSAYLRNYDVKDRRKILSDVFFDGQVTGAPIGPVFLLLPLGLLALRKRQGRRLLIAGSILLATYFANISTRFLLPSLPFFTLALTMAFEGIPLALLAMALFHAWSSWPPELRRHAKPAWAIQHIPVKAALRLQSEDDYLSKSRGYRLARFIARWVPVGEKVLLTDGVAALYADRDTLVCYEGALNEQLCDILGAAWDEFSKPSRALVFRFPEHALNGIRVVQTAKAPKPDEQWSVHELRIFRNTSEVPRSADWRLSAFPNPWDVGYAFDNSEVTRWRSWETAAPGMYMSVRFPSEVPANQVRIETSGDNPDIKLRLEEIDTAGKWKPLGAAPEEFTLSPEGSLRRAAAYELKAHGIGYIFVEDRDRDHGGPLFAEDPESWNFTPVARAEGMTIYKVGR